MYQSYRSIIMTMHLDHPSLTLLGKHKSKVKFRSSEQAKKARELELLWEENKKKWAKLSKGVPLPKTKTWQYSLTCPPGREVKYIPSKPDTHLGAVTIKPNQHYTGNKMIGVGTLHKSNAVPIFSDEEAKDISKMRRG